ncbi:MAG: DUF4352 domain-containing protein [Lachnospiraceae bacterium]|nr:DUF4352 domain-containing protein [Lachnospiraceae bacterium]
MNYLIVLLIGVVALIFFVLLIVGLVNPQMVRCTSRIGVFFCFGTFAFASGIAELLLLETLEIPIVSYPASTVYVPLATNTPKHVSEHRRHREPNNRQLKVASIGQNVRMYYFSYTVKNFSFRKTFGDTEYGTNLTADGIYLIVNLSMSNLSDAPSTFPFEDFFVTDKNGSRYTYQKYATYWYKIDASPDFGVSVMQDFWEGRNFQPNVPTREYLLFEVPERGTYYLQLSGGFTAVVLE